MINEEFGWQTSDHVQLYAQLWKPDAEPTGVVCLVHGLGEHSGRYTHVAQKLTNAGLAVIALDLRGHGKSGGLRGHTPSVEAWFSDIDLLIKEAAKRYPGKPVVLYGHSMGGLLVLNYVLQRKPALRGVVSTSPALITPLQEQKGKMLLASVMGSILPTMTMSSGLDAAGLSHDTSVVERYKNDPLVHDKTTTGLGKAIMQSMNYVFAHASEFPVPLLLMQGSEDPICLPSGAEKFAASAPGTTIFKIWPGKLHELHNEFGKEEVLDYMVTWILKKMGAETTGQRPPDVGKFEPAG